MSDVGLAIQRAEDKTEQMKARAGAIDELMASGALSDALGGPPPDDIQAELDRMGASHGVDAELAQMKAELGRRRDATADRGRSGQRCRAGQRQPSYPVQQPHTGEGQ